MPRDASGNMTLTAGNPVLAGTPIDPLWANLLTEDLRSEIQQSLSRQGKGGMVAPLRTQDGTALAPAHSFTNDTDCGMYLAGADDVRLAVGGAAVAKVTSAGVALINGSAAAPALAFLNEEDTGLYTTAANDVRVAAGGAEAMRVGTTGVTMKKALQVGEQAVWVASTVYAIGDQRINQGNLYVCDQNGTSASSGGPTGTGSNIADGTTRWDYVASADGDGTIQGDLSVRGTLTVEAPTAVREVGGAGEPAFAGAWANQAGRRKLVFWKDVTGCVHIEGTVGSGVSGSTVFTLPATGNYRPASTHIAMGFDNSVDPIAWISVFSDGHIEIAGAGSLAAVSVQVIYRPDVVNA